ncbi:metallophosphoesterase [Intrasporangium sp.]|uniref:metallophosphoesterase family protein n=1 Tax=Intrasporangium sp. TaxID=1925024 RepID=UPI00293A2966|nr:metallophosphoesterase [Intrasporangium sp.]MDV3223410.1 metallophosphoesterase [Intrasporangium sp.]
MRLTTDHPVWARVGLVARWLAIVVACYLGGVAATNLSPTTVETAHYRATLRLDPVPRHMPVLHSPTIVGDVDLTFTSPVLAPGLDVAVSVREEITNLLSRGPVSVSSLQPTDAEISAAIREAAVGVWWRFGLGALVVAVALSVAVHYARRRRPERMHLVLVAAALVLVAAGTGVSTALTYQPGRFAALTTTGVLGTVQRNAGLLAGVETRAEQATPYLRNLLALSQALQAKFVPTDLTQPDISARFLLVSDIHGANQYPLMRTIIEEEDVDAVIDTGDIINFGRVQEGEAGGIFRGIESLGVPYLFVSGNHDQSSPTDRELLRRMAQIPNVVLLQDAEGVHRELSFHGLRITGFNDPRYFGDDNEDPAGKQAPAVEAFNTAMEDEPESDLVLTHEPYAATGVDRGRILVNGHIHTPVLDGSRIQAGTFTGGGVVSHFIATEDEELRGQPYAFDLLSFGPRCSLTQLTRYSYRNLIEGRPAYDNIQVINGATIDPRGAEAARAAAEAERAAAEAPAPDVGEPVPEDEQPRTCSRLEETTVREITTATPDNAGTATPATVTTSTLTPVPSTPLPSTPAGSAPPGSPTATVSP